MFLSLGLLVEQYLGIQAIEVGEVNSNLLRICVEDVGATPPDEHPPTRKKQRHCVQKSRRTGNNDCLLAGLCAKRVVVQGIWHCTSNISVSEEHI